MNSTTITRSRRIDSGQPLFFWPENDASVGYAVTTTVCENPRCDCDRMGLIIERAVRRDDGFAELEPVPGLLSDVSSDGTDVTLADERGELPGEALAWLREQLNDVSYRDWYRERWARGRGQVGDPKFPSGTAPVGVDGMILFSEVFPYEFDLVVTDGDHAFLVEDQYCLNPACSCDDIVTQFVDISAGNAHVVGHAKASARRLTSPELHGPSLVARLWRDLLDNHGADRLRARFDRMRRVSRTSTGATSSASGARTSPKAGRNEACPCGSGKKFKRCCSA